MEANGTLDLFLKSMKYNLRCSKLVCDGDSKTHSLLLQKKKPYGDVLEGQKLSDGKTIGERVD